MRITAIESAPFHSLTYSLAPGANAPRARLPFVRAFVDELPDGVEAILATSDLQGVVRAGGATIGLGEELARTIASLRREGRLPVCPRTAAILAGDLHPGAGDDDVLPVWRAIAGTCRWVAGVAGNHDRLGGVASSAAAREALCGTNAHFLDGSTVTLDGIRIGGLSGIVGSSDSPWLRREEGYTAALAVLLREGCDLLILHDGPNAAGTRLPGWPSVRRILEAAPPALVIRGHDHWDDPVAALVNGTQVLNVEGRVVVLQRRAGGAVGGT